MASIALAPSSAPRRRRERLGYEDLFRLKWLLGAFMALCSLWTLSEMEESSAPLLLGAAATIALGTLFPRWPARLPAATWKVVPVLIALYVAWAFAVSGANIVPPLLHLIVLLLVLRALQQRTRREDLQLVLVCLFVNIISGVLTLSFAFAFQILVFLGLAMALLLTVELVRCHDRGAAPPEDVWQRFSWPRLLRKVVAVADLPTLAFAGVVFGVLVAVASAVFVLMPRVGFARAIPFLRLESKSRTGFSEEIQFGDVVRILEDDSVAFSVEAPEGTAPAHPYWRMVVLDEYYRYRDGRGRERTSFRTSEGSRRGKKTYFGSRFTGRSENVALPESGGGGTWTFYLEGGVSRYLPSMGVFEGIRFPGRQRVEFNRAVRTVNIEKKTSAVLSFQYENPVPLATLPATHADGKLHPRVEGVHIWERPVRPPLFLDLDDPDGPARKLGYPYTTLMLPREERSALEGIVREITGGEPTDAESFSRKAVRYLNGRHAYALETRIPPGREDLLVRWMRSGQPGHCELFAGSFALLARAAGFPCRVVAGFKGWVRNEFEGYYMVRNRDAHAWCEIYDPRGRPRDRGWLRVDPTPGAGGAGGVGGDLGFFGSVLRDSSLRAFLESLRIVWYRSVVNFDREAQGELIGGVHGWFGRQGDGAGRFLSERWRSALGWAQAPWGAAKALAAFKALLLAAALFFAVRIALPHLVGFLAAALGRRGGLGRRRKAPARPDRVRRKAGKLVAQFRRRRLTPHGDVKRAPAGNGQGRVAEGAPAVLAADLEGVWMDLLHLRFGEAGDRPDHRLVFRRARRLLRLRGHRVAEPR